MTRRWQIQLKQRGGKWAPQCEFNNAKSLDAAWLRMKRMGRYLRAVQFNADGTREVIGRYRPEKRT